MHVFFLLLAVFFLWAPVVEAGEIVAVDQANPPFMYDNDGQAGGIYPALVQEAFRRMGEDVQIPTLPWKRAINEANAGACGIAGIYKNGERLKVLEFSDKLYDEVVIVYVAKGKTFPSDGVRGLYGKAVGVLRGWSYGDEFDAAVKSGKIRAEEVSGDLQNFQKLVAGRLDAVLVNRESAKIIVSSGGIKDRVDASAAPFLASSTYLAFAKSARKTDLIARFNAALREMHADGSFDRIVSSIVAAP